MNRGLVMKKLSATDQLFLWLEKRQQPMHVGGLQVFKYPKDAGPRYMRDLVEQLHEYSSPEPPFSQCLVQKRGQYYWQEDDQFDLDYHFRHAALPKPGRIRELLALVSNQHAHLLDRTRPLWEVHLIEGVKQRRFAIYSKVHHAVTDGVGAMRLTMNALSTDPLERDQPALWASPLPHTHVRSNREIIATLLKNAQITSKQAFSLPKVGVEILRSIRMAKKDEGYVSIFQAPQSVLNGRITAGRRFAAQAWSIERFKAVADAFDATLNDVVLAVCGSTIRNYLITYSSLPDQPLIAMVPVSLALRDSSGQQGGGNQITMVLANLGTHVADPATRMRIVKESMNHAKQRLSSMSREELVNYSAMVLAPSLLHQVTGLAPKMQAYNVVISNVPGPRKTLYLNGAKLEGMYPVSIPIDRNVLNITLLSYEDKLEFGVIGCRRTLPHLQKMLDYLEYGITDLERAGGLR